MSSDSNPDPNPNPNPKVGYIKRMIEWRRNKVLHRLTLGWSQADIARELKLHPSTISLDVQFLKENAKKELETHIQERLPFEYARAMAGINNVLKRVSEILDSAPDNRTKMEALKLQMDLYQSIMSLATNGGIVERAIKLVNGMESRDQLQAAKRAMSEVQVSVEDANNEKTREEDEEGIPIEEEKEEDLREE